MCVAEGRGGGGEQGVQQGDGGVLLRGQLLLCDRRSQTHQVLVPGPLQAHQGADSMLHSLSHSMLPEVMLLEVTCDRSLHVTVVHM